jgi:TPR repeat protein
MDFEDLRLRAERGSLAAQSILGLSYLHGEGVAQDLEEAFRWLTSAAERGAARAEAWLGSMYESGLGVPVDLVRARALYQGAASKGEFFGCIFLARLLARDVAAAGDRTEASRWYAEAIKMDVAPCPELEEARRFLA